MICFNYSELTQFLSSLSRRASNEIFVHFSGEGSFNEQLSQKHRIILQFLGKPIQDNLAILVLHQCAILIKSEVEKNNIFDEIKKTFEISGVISLINGNITEVVQSIS